MKIDLSKKAFLPKFLLILSLAGLVFGLLRPASLNNLNRLISYLAAVECPASCTYGCGTEIPGANNGVCDRLVDIINTVGTVDCSLTATSGFKTATPNFVTANGIRYFNFGSNADADGVYTIYADIDGNKRNGVLNEDVLAFNIYLDGSIFPTSDSIAANNRTYLSASVIYENTDGTLEYPLNGVSYREALCKAGLGPSTAYCTGYSTITACSAGNHECSLVINKPQLTLTLPAK